MSAAAATVTAAAAVAAVSTAATAALTLRASFVDYEGPAAEVLLVLVVDRLLGVGFVDIDEAETSALDYPCGRSAVGSEVFKKGRFGSGVGQIAYV